MTTAWVDKNLARAWDRIEAVSPAGAESMPLVSFTGRGPKLVAQELGCGHYGCVMPTNLRNMVFKLSSDPTEAFFIAAAHEIGGDGYDDAGIVQYHGVYALRGATHRRRQVFALWREEAFDLGFPIKHGYGDRSFDARRDKDLVDGLNGFKMYADSVRNQLASATKRGKDPFALLSEAQQQFGEWAWENVDYERVLVTAKRWGGDSNSHAHTQFRGAQRIAANLRACVIIAENMENTDGSDTIGRTLGFYLENGLLLADVHANNVGKVMRHDDTWDGEVRVITDPGHAIALSSRWANVIIDEI